MIRDIVASGAAQFIGCDITKAGGVSAMQRTAALCESYGVRFVPHNTSHGLGHIATLQFIAATPDCDFYQEYSIQPPDARSGSILNRHPPKGGKIAVDTQAPVIGALIDEKMVTQKWQVVK